MSALRAELGTSRKYAVPLMEHLDRTGVTRRDGDLRFPRASAPGPVAWLRGPRDHGGDHDLDRRPERQLGDADRRAGVATLLPEDLNEDVARAVRHRRVAQ